MERRRWRRLPVTALYWSAAAAGYLLVWLLVDGAAPEPSLYAGREGLFTGDRAAVPVCLAVAVAVTRLTRGGPERLILVMACWPALLGWFPGLADIFGIAFGLLLAAVMVLILAPVAALLADG